MKFLKPALLVIGGFIVLILVPSALFFGNATLVTYSDAVNIYLVIILLILTAWYTYFAQITVNEIRKDRSLNVRPALIPGSMTIKDDNAWEGEYSCTTIDLKNVGNGAAFSIHVSLIDPETKREIAKSKNHVDYLTSEGTTDDNHIHIENKKLKELKYKEIRGDMVAHVRVRISYDDMFGKTYSSERTFTIKKGDRYFKQTVGSFKLDLASEVK